MAVAFADGELTFPFRRFQQAMNVAVRPEEVTVAGRERVWPLRGHSTARARLSPLADTTDVPYPPQSSAPVTVHARRSPKYYRFLHFAQSGGHSMEKGMFAACSTVMMTWQAATDTAGVGAL